MTTQKVVILFVILVAVVLPVRAQSNNSVVITNTVLNLDNYDVIAWHPHAIDKSQDYRVHISLEVTAENRRILNDDYDWFNGVTLQGSGNVNRHDTAGLLLAVGSMRLKPGSRASQI